MDTAEIIERAAAGDAEGFREFVQRYRKVVYAVCWSQLPNPNDLDDLAQEVFLQVHRDLPGLRDPARVLPWLRQVARNTCRQRLRRKRVPEAPLTAAGDAEDTSAREMPRRAELREVVTRTLAEVSAKSRQALALRYLAGCSETEVARTLGISPGAAKSRLHEGRKQARRVLAPVVRELLQLEAEHGETVDRIMARCGSPHCCCPETLTEGR